ncbi:amino acid deaminase [Pelagibius sp. CAU 1746]|uniref:amino acid deaminase n=1 Tax=Pelagibius sp. CAU 1746 TaxID=3140370 RepID=UPI00325AD0B8
MAEDCLDNLLLDDTLKGVPGGQPPFRIADAGGLGWNLLAEDLPLPVAVLKESAIEHNSAWMKAFLAASGVLLAPHGKTTMSPQLFHRQLRDGAWGITLATIQQVQAARRFGIGRILLANQLVGKQAIRYVLDELEKDPDFDFYCLVDSVEGVESLARAARERGLSRPLQVLIEGGLQGARTGCRDLDEALAVSRAVGAHAPLLALRGVEGFEGIIADPDPVAAAKRVAAFLRFLGDIAKRCEAEGLLAPGPVILTAGGSAFYDIVAEIFNELEFDREKYVVIRSGCYLTHDSIMYDNFARQMHERSQVVRDIGSPLRPALEVWAYVQSRPETNRVFLILGKRDCSYDAGLPRPAAWFRPGSHRSPQELSQGHECVEINDQHLFMDVPDDSPLSVGDMVSFGISHPCLTFDKWQAVAIVDDDYNVVSMIRTFF